MSVKSAIYRLVEELPEADAELVLAYVSTMVSRQPEGTEPHEPTGGEPDAVEWLKPGKPTSADDPLWKLVGVVKDDGPTDVARNHDAYLAEMYGDLHRDE